MAYTLISSVGTGMYKDAEFQKDERNKNKEFKDGYEVSTYVFPGPDGKEFKTNIFINAVLATKYKPFEKIILVGTRTSSWDALINLDTEDEKVEELWQNVYDICKPNAGGITDKLVDELQHYLSNQYGIPVHLKVHTQNIDFDTSEEVFNCYKSIGKEIAHDSDILFDITHGFRSMPILMYQTLQFVFSNNQSRKVELVYGEYKPSSYGNTKSYVRDLSKYWELAQATDAISVFTKKLDGNKLADMMEQYWKDGAKLIRRISDTVQTNFSLQIVETIRNIKNVLKTYPENMPSWGVEVKQEMEKFLQLLDETSQAKTLYKYAKFLYEKHLNTQAIITMQVAAETAIAEKYGEKTPSGETKNVGDYKWWSDTGDKELIRIKNTDKEMKRLLSRLENKRNQIAHGGTRDRNKDLIPALDNIPQHFEDGKKGVEMLFEYLDKN